MSIFSGEQPHNILDLGFDKLLTRGILGSQGLLLDVSPEMKNVFIDGLSPKNIISGQLVARIESVSGYLQSDNFVSGSAGWKLDPTTGDLSSITINSSIITGGVIQTASSGRNIVLRGSNQSIEFYDFESNLVASIEMPDAEGNALNIFPAVDHLGDVLSLGNSTNRWTTINLRGGDEIDIKAGDAEIFLDSLLGHTIYIPLTNKSGGQVVSGDVIIIETNTNGSFTTTTSAGDVSVIGIVAETIADNATGRVVVAGYETVLCSTGAVARGDILVTHTSAKQAVVDNTPSAGAIIGKALRAKGAGSTGLVGTLITLG